MNKFLLTLSVVFCAMRFSAQADLYLKFKKAVEVAHPELNLENKLLAINFWEVSDPESREANKGFERAGNAYQNAKLKGGLKGLVVVLISKDDLSSVATITLNKDGVVKSLSLKAEDLGDLTDTSGIRNLVFDSDGNESYRNIPAAGVFDSIHKLITR